MNDILDRLHRLPARLALVAGVVLLPAAAAGQVFVFHLEGEQEAPPVPSSSSGGCWAELDQGAAELELLCTHDVLDATLIHVHRGAPGVNGAALFDMGAPASPVHATWTGMSGGDIAELLAGELYVNIHSGGRPSGEIRGQIRDRTVDQFAFSLEGAQQAPPVVTSAEGTCLADLASDATSLAVACEHSVSEPTMVHLHQGSAGTNGPVIHHFTDLTSPISENVPLSPEHVANLAGSLLYVNVHSATVPDGEVRGQVVDEPVFTDAFESGDTTGWSSTNGVSIVTFAAQCPGDCLFDTGQTITFDVVVQGNPTLYEYDWDGNGSFEESSPTVVTTHAYAAAGSFVPRLRVSRDAFSQTKTHDETLFIGAE